MATFITGGHGQIGSWIAYLLAKEGEDVIILDNQPKPPDYLDAVSKQIRFVRGDVMDFPCSVGDAAALSQKHSHFPVKVDIGPGTLMPRCNALDITRAKEEFGYTPKYDLEAGIQDYAEWIKKQIEGS